MSLESDIRQRTDEVLRARYDVSRANVTPTRSSVTFGATSKQFWARVVYIDLRGSKKLVSASGPETALKAHKAFLYAVAKCMRRNGGDPRSFNGDSVLTFFSGKGTDSACAAVKAAMQTKWCIEEFVNTELRKRYGEVLNFGVGIAQGEIHVGKSGVAGDENFQDLVWVGWPVYHAVVFGDRARKPDSIWISKNVWNAIKSSRNLVYSKDINMWAYADEELSIGTRRVYKTTYRWRV